MPPTLSSGRSLPNKYDPEHHDHPYPPAQGRTHMVDDAYGNNNFNPVVDRESKYHTATVLATPIRGSNGLVLGVMQVPPCPN